MKKLLIALCAACTLLTLSGCRSTAYYQNQAVKEARAYLLEEVGPQLTLQQREYVKFNKPILLVSSLLPAPSFGYEQVCVTWLIPGIQEACMVYGYGDKQMIGWSPNRIIWQDFSPWDQNRQKAVKSARDYAINNLFFPLSVEQFNRVRFDAPQIIITDFDLIDEYVGELDDTAVTALTQHTKVQFSIVWPLGETPEQYVVLCGRSEPDLKGWTIDFGAIVTEEELKQHTLDGAPASSLDAVNFVEVGAIRLTPANQ